MSHPEHGDEDDDQPGPNTAPIENKLVHGALTAMGGIVGGMMTGYEMGKIRKVLERIADAMELTAVVNAQVCVPEEVGRKLDPWRDNILDRMAQRYMRKLRRDNDRLKKRIAKLQKDQGVGATHPNMRGEPAEGTFYGEPADKVMGTAAQKDQAAVDPNGATEPASSSAGTEGPCRDDSRQQAAGAVDSQTG